MSGESHGEVRQEPDRIRTRRVVFIGVAALLAFAAGIAWAASIQKHANGTLRSDTAPRPPLAGRTEIGMVFQPIFDHGSARSTGIAAEQDAAKLEILDSYGWVGPQGREERKVVHIPIDRAIDLLIERGKL
jgi:hypothetical protein